MKATRVDPLCQAVEQAWKAGITVVVAAGNYGRANPTTTFGYGTITAPGNDPYVITVGAMNDMGTPSLTDDVITTYSSKGPTLFDMVAKPDIVAPGNLIDSLEAPNSTLFTDYPQRRHPDEPLHEHQQRDGLRQLHPAERHEHGDSVCERDSGADASAASHAHAGSGKGKADEVGG